MKQIAIAIVLVGSDFCYWYARERMGDADKAINVLGSVDIISVFVELELK